MAEEPLLLTQVVFSERELKLALTTHGISMTTTDGKPLTSKVQGLHCEWRDIITVRKSEDEKETSCLVKVHYIEKQKNKTLRLKSAVIGCSKDNFEKVFSIMKENCRNVPNRPKKLFVLINPIGGNHQGVQIYHKKIEPIFALAECETTVVTSDYAKHAIEIGETQDMTGYDGVICVSGDGLFQEFLQGHMKKLQRDAGIDVNNPEAEFVKPKIPFCLIPAGTGNTKVRYTNDDVIDLETSALRPFRGEIHTMSIMTVHGSGRLLGLGGIGIAVGLFTDSILLADGHRWMGRARNLYALVVGLIKKRRLYDAKIQYLLAEESGKGPGEGGTRQGWLEFDSNGKLHTNTCFLSCNLVNLGDKMVVNPYSKTGFLFLDTGCSNWGLFKYARSFLTQQQTTAILNLDWKHNVIGLKIKICQEDEGDEGVTPGRRESTPENDPKFDLTAKIGNEGPEKQSDDGGISEVKDDAVKASGCSTSQKSGAKSHSAPNRDRELEHYINLDGETLRCDKLEFECRELQVIEAQIVKVIQFYETMLVRHGVMLVGPTGGGKTTIYQILAETLGNLQKEDLGNEFYQEVHTFVLNPKAISMEELYGGIDKLTMEWKDGLMGLTVRHAVQVFEECWVFAVVRT